MITEDNLKNLGLEYVNEHPTIKDVKYMGPNGCIVPPEHRPFCTCFACPAILESRKVRREYERLHAKIKYSDYMRRAMEVVPDVQKVIDYFQRDE